MTNYQYDDFDIKPLVTSILWFFFMAQANIQIWYNNFNSNYASPLFMYVEKFLNLADEDEDDDESYDNKPTEHYCDFKFISCELLYDDDQDSKSLIIKLNDSDYVIGKKLFTNSWIKNYIDTNTDDTIKHLNNDLIINENYIINFIDHNINQIKINSDQYIILDNNNYIIKTI